MELRRFCIARDRTKCSNKVGVDMARSNNVRVRGDFEISPSTTPSISLENRSQVAEYVSQVARIAAGETISTSSRSAHDDSAVDVTKYA